MKCKSIELLLITPERILLRKSCNMILLPGLEGELGVMAGHEPVVLMLREGGRLKLCGIVDSEVVKNGVDVMDAMWKVNKEEDLGIEKEECVQNKLVDSESSGVYDDNSLKSISCYVFSSTAAVSSDMQDVYDIAGRTNDQSEDSGIRSGGSSRSSDEGKGEGTLIEGQQGVVIGVQDVKNSATISTKEIRKSIVEGQHDKDRAGIVMVSGSAYIDGERCIVRVGKVVY